jgi:hypothetical protein
MGKMEKSKEIIDSFINGNFSQMRAQIDEYPVEREVFADILEDIRNEQDDYEGLWLFSRICLCYHRGR